ncbi:glyoxalase I [Clavulina sp. PMI_390]|nr:glyoxalase I [Clavulina sp. PMI_390]
MIRVKDAKASLKWYQEVLGMTLLDESDYGDFSLYFLAFVTEDEKSLSTEELSKTKFARQGVLELTHNHGTESDSTFAGYSSGNTEPGRGFGHIAICVPDVQAACDHFDKMEVNYKKRLTDGKMRNIAFILDPDGYWVEIVPAGGL